MYVLALIAAIAVLTIGMVLWVTLRERRGVTTPSSDAAVPAAIATKPPGFLEPPVVAEDAAGMEPPDEIMLPPAARAPAERPVMDLIPPEPIVEAPAVEPPPAQEDLPRVEAPAEPEQEKPAPPKPAERRSRGSKRHRTLTAPPAEITVP